LQHTATHCTTLQLTATHCNTLQQLCNTACSIWRIIYHRIALGACQGEVQHTATHCNTLKLTTTTLQQHCNNTATHPAAYGASFIEMRSALVMEKTMCQVESLI